MKVYYIIPFTGIPVTSRYLNDWYCGINDMEILDVRYSFWNYLFSEKAANIIDSTGVLSDSEARQSAVVQLENLNVERTYKSIDDYSCSIDSIDTYIQLINKYQDELVFNIVNGVRYSSESSQERLSVNLLEKLLEGFVPDWIIDSDICFHHPLSYNEFEFSVLISKVIKKSNANSRQVIIHKTFENYCPDVSMYNSDSITRYIDCILLNSDRLSLENFLDRMDQDKSEFLIIDGNDINDESSGEGTLNQLITTDEFNYKKTLAIRLSKNVCHWNKCSFCSHKEGHYESNSKDYDSFKHIEKSINRGITSFSFTDETLDYELLFNFSKWIMSNYYKIEWGFRTRLDCKMNDLLMDQLESSGCCSIVFGLESVNLETLVSMRKYKNPFDITRSKSLISKLSDHNIFVHLNVIVGYPTETFEETDKTVNYVKDFLKLSENYTFSLNQFTLFKGTYIYKHPQMYDVKILNDNLKRANHVEFEIIGNRKYSSDILKYISSRYNFLWQHQVCSKHKIATKLLYNNTLHGIHIRKNRIEGETDGCLTNK